MPRQLGLNDSRMYGRSAHPTFAVPLVELYGEKNVCGFRPPIRDEGIVGSPLKVRILEVDVRVAVTCGRQVDQPPSPADERRNPVHQDKVPQVIGAELHLEMVGRIAERRGHHTCVGDDHIERLALSEQSIGAVSDAREAGQIEFDELEASTIRRRVLSYLSSRRLGLGQVARGANY